MGRNKRSNAKNQKNVDFKKTKVKVGRVIKKTNETLPQVKVGRILLQNQFEEKLNRAFVKNIIRTNVDKTQEEIDEVPPSAFELSEIRRKIMLELKDCTGTTTKQKDTAGCLVLVRELLCNTHHKLAVWMQSDVIEKICCPFIYDKQENVRLEVPNLLRCILQRSLKANKFKEGFVPLTAKACPILPVSLCRGISDNNTCLEALNCLDVICELCPKVVQSYSQPLLQSLISILYKQNYFLIADRASEMNMKNKFMNGEKIMKIIKGLDLQTTWLLPQSIPNINKQLTLKSSRTAVMERLAKVFTLLTCPAHRCFPFDFPNNIMDYEIKCQEFARICLEILFATWSDLTFTDDRAEEENVINFDHASFTVACSLLACMKAALDFALMNTLSKNEFLLWLKKEVSSVYEQSMAAKYPYVILKKSSKKKTSEVDMSSTINRLVEAIKSHFDDAPIN